MKKLALLIAVVALAAVPLVAQGGQKIDITGAWEMTVESPQGQMVLTVNFKQDGETITGNQVSEMGEAPLKGTLKGADLVYTVSIDMGGMAFEIGNKGTVEGDTMKGTGDLGEMGSFSWTAKRKQ